MTRATSLAMRAVQRLGALCALTGFLLGSVAVPLPRTAMKTGAAPFPCQGHRCGCSTARQCWQSCCCFSSRERMRWALEHRVTPPASLVAATGREAASASCCSVKRPGHDHADTSAKRSERWTVEFVSFVDARKCQGQAELWLTLSAMPPLPKRVAVDCQAIASGAVCARPVSMASVCKRPLVPPPKA